jgi:5-methylcytosine-specific restriction endonuclease McrA
MAVRDYKHEYEKFQSSPLAKKRRAMRNKARRLLMRMGRVHKGDHRDVDHVVANRGGKLNSRLSNLRVTSEHFNRGRNNN